MRASIRIFTGCLAVLLLLGALFITASAADAPAADAARAEERSGGPAPVMEPLSAAVPENFQVRENESVMITENAAPLAAGPGETACCILHLLILLAALAVELAYIHDRKKRQRMEFQIRMDLI